jgi:hypothetical protein
MTTILTRVAAAAAMVLVAWVDGAGTTAQTAPAAAENTGPNKSITRWAEGSYIYRGDNGARERGTENFRLNVHPDGTRTLIMWHDLYARNIQYTVVLRTAADFRPLQAFANYWSENGYKGSILVTLNGDRLHAVSNGPNGMVTQDLMVPRNVSIGTHPVSGDGWHGWYIDEKAKGVQEIGVIYGIESGGDLTKPALGALRPQKFEVLGREKITVPAGTFEAQKLRIAGSSEAWIMGPDKILVRMANARGQDYVLAAFTSGDNAKKN